MNILVTGGSGFIGSNFIIYMLNKYPNYKIVNLDLLTYAADQENLAEVEKLDSYHFIKGDICDRKLVEELFREYKFQGVIHFAAESHVDNSIKSPGKFIKTNLEGTFTILDVARQNWLNEDQEGINNSRFVHISTDEVYGSLSEEGFFSESTPYAPNSPYSASKAGADMIVRSYFQTYDMNVVTTNCSNNFGPRQHSEKLIPTIIKNVMSLNEIPIYGNGMNVRDWLYVEDHCQAIDIIFHEGTNGETYLIGGDNERNNLEIVYMICDMLDVKLENLLKNSKLNSFRDLVQFVEDRAGHDFRYSVDASKVKKNFDWRPEKDFERLLSYTIDWYIERVNK